MMTEKKNNVSIVTVCLNAIENIEKTVQSVLDLEGSNFEYIVKDGGSQDGTLSILEAYKEKFAVKGINYKIISQKDSGIYDSMNQAVRYCANEWTIFMNAGDVFFNARVIEDIFFREFDERIGIVYGHANYKLSNGYNIIIKSNLEISSQIALCHQAIFVRTELLRKNEFDCKYKLVADRDLIFRLLADGYEANNVNVVVCIYARDGASSFDYVTLRREIYQCNKIYKILPNKYNYLIAVIKQYVNKVCPMIADIVLCKKSMKT